MSLRHSSLGKAGFAERHGLWNDGREKAADHALKLATEKNLETLRLAFADQHGILRGKTLLADELEQALRSGCTMTTTLLAKDTAHRTVFPVWSADGGFDIPGMNGAGDFVMLPDPATFKVLPWAPHTGWMLCDIYFPDGRPVPFSTRQIYRDALAKLAARGFDYVVGLEIEFHVFRLEDEKLQPEQAGQPGPPPQVNLLAHGFQYLTEQRADQLDAVFELLRKPLLQLGLPLRSMEVEFGPSQCEFTFHPGSGLEPADNMILLRSAVKQICRRHGLHATFMCRPALANIFSSGWHLHQSLSDRSNGQNAFCTDRDDQALSATGRHFIGGLLKHARAAAVFSTPTINGYKRYRPYTLAPDRVSWARDNRGSMLRVIAAAGDPATRIENRAGEPAANPYLYMASQVLCGLDGIENRFDPGEPADTPYDTPAQALPGSLMEAVMALHESAFFRTALGDRFVDYIVTIKQAEIARFLAEVTDREQREYFDIF
jgi:glutamine synthetase